MHLLIAAVLAASIASAADGQSILSRIREVFLAHGAVPYVAYTLQREQSDADGLRDLTWSYTYRVWYRASDEAAMGRKLFRGRPQGLEYFHVMFDQACDPGPPTANLFELPALRSREDAPPPPSLTVIANVRAVARSPYDVTFARLEDGAWHLGLRPRTAPERNRIREVWADAQTFQMRKAVVTDKLFIVGGPVYDQLDTLTLTPLGGRPVITHIHTRANYDSEPFGDGLDVDYSFSDITFPAALPQWFFEPQTYGAHMAEAPE